MIARDQEINMRALPILIPVSRQIDVYAYVPRGEAGRSDGDLAVPRTRSERTIIFPPLTLTRAFEGTALPARIVEAIPPVHCSSSTSWACFKPLYPSWTIALALRSPEDGVSHEET